MNIKKFRYRIFYLLLITKLLIFLWLIILWTSHAYSTPKFKELTLLITPLFVTNITIGLKFFLNEFRKTAVDTTSIVTPPVKVIFFVITIIYGIWMIFLLGYFSTLTGDEDSYTSLKELIGLGEIFFGGYIGFIVIDIFDKTNLE